MRDLYANEPTYINAVGGDNGKGVAVEKSLLIDLEPLTGKAEGDKGQAGLEAWAA